METRLQYDLQEKQLKFHVRQRVSTEQKLEFKAVGLLDPSTASLSHYRAALKQHVTLGSGPELRDSGSKPFRLGAGVAVVSGPGGSSAKPATTRGSSAAAAGASRSPFANASPLLTVSAEKKVGLLDGPNTVLTLRAVADWDMADRRLASRSGLVKLSHTLPGFTRRQDLKLAAGMTVDWQPGARTEPRPSLFLQARENNWAATLKEGRINLTYDL
ncbi:hypothetical protein Agub_g3867 [Astrephomene gubernaculifera]|uniref:Uncharacterized protein n=1 Tax=Astrephomene gubernaculifera TaxID=47775 RepID=A0AAD3HJQ7_9CHLO|nr:hypothetical protein Agub_g3867 [Astrephomene gubernaculifera]